jgi:hypothetical protein
MITCSAYNLYGKITLKVLKRCYTTECFIDTGRLPAQTSRSPLGAQSHCQRQMLRHSTEADPRLARKHSLLGYQTESHWRRSGDEIEKCQRLPSTKFARRGASFLSECGGYPDGISAASEDI